MKFIKNHKIVPQLTPFMDWDILPLFESSDELRKFAADHGVCLDDNIISFPCTFNWIDMGGCTHIIQVYNDLDTYTVINDTMDIKIKPNTGQPYYSMSMWKWIKLNLFWW